MHWSDHRASWPLRKPDPEWFKDVTIGSVLREPNGGPFRIVRYVTRRRCDGRLMFVGFAIRRSSWTGRCYTMYTASDIKSRGFTMVPHVRVKLDKLIDVRIAQAMAQDCTEPYMVHAREVVGLP